MSLLPDREEKLIKEKLVFSAAKKKKASKESKPTAFKTSPAPVLDLLNYALPFAVSTRRSSAGLHLFPAHPST